MTGPHGDEPRSPGAPPTAPEPPPGPPAGMPQPPPAGPPPGWQQPPYGWQPAPPAAPIGTSPRRVFWASFFLGPLWWFRAKDARDRAEARGQDGRPFIRAWGWGWATGAGAGLLVGFGVALAIILTVVNSDDDDETTSASPPSHGRVAVLATDADVAQARDDALAQAKTAMIALSSVKAVNAEADVNRVLSMATGQFAAEFRNNSSSFTDIVRQANVDSTAVIDDAGVQSIDRDTGRVRVLVALTSTIKNNSIPQGEQRPFRMAVTMVEEADIWKVDRVEYIP